MQPIATGFVTVFEYFQNKATGNRTELESKQLQPKNGLDHVSVQFSLQSFSSPMDQTFKHYLPAFSSPMPGPTPPQEAPMSLVAPPTSTTDPLVSDPHPDNQTDNEHDHFTLDRPATHIG